MVSLSIGAAGSPSVKFTVQFEPHLEVLLIQLGLFVVGYWCCSWCVLSSNWSTVLYGTFGVTPVPSPVNDFLEQMLQFRLEQQCKVPSPRE